MHHLHGRGRVWLGNFHRRRVMLWSPLPVSGCVQRLAEVTTSRGPATWYLDPRTVGRPEPRFRGQAGQSWIRLARFSSRAGRNSFFAVLDVQPGPGADGGTALSGWVGSSEGVEFLPVLTAAFGLASLGLLAAGIAQLVSGHLIGLVPAAAFPLPIAAIAGFNAVGHRYLERDISELLQEVNEVLGSTAVPPGPSATPTQAELPRSRPAVCPAGVFRGVEGRRRQRAKRALGLTLAYPNAHSAR